MLIIYAISFTEYTSVLNKGDMKLGGGNTFILGAGITGLSKELQNWQFIKEVEEVVDPIWIDVAYTWSWPGSTWREEAIQKLKEHNIFQLGRYGQWKFQGIAESIQDGMLAPSILPEG